MNKFNFIIDEKSINKEQYEFIKSKNTKYDNNDDFMIDDNKRCYLKE